MKRITPIITLVLLFGILNNASAQKSEKHLKINKIKEIDSINNYIVQNNIIDYTDIALLSKDEKNHLKSASLNDVYIRTFNTKKISPDNNCFVAYFEGEAPSKYIGFFNKDGDILHISEVNIEPVVNFSSNSNFLVVFSFYQNVFFCFTNKGELIFKGLFDQILPDAEIIHNAFIDDTGKYLLVSSSYMLHMIDLSKGEILWEIKTKSRRVINCHFNSKLGIVATTALLADKDMIDKEDIFNLEFRSIKNGTEKGRIPNVSKTIVKGKHFLARSNNKWYEYEVTWDPDEMIK
ncbi:hypothetical protein ACE01N_07900 [Saccharicrinis sp. FJH2]|uniref:hypothetical protein n=1 Tax=Saccharicrinis sp. FJH65 TaxID=3344659 RepID=UPI0035F3F337